MRLFITALVAAVLATSFASVAAAIPPWVPPDMRSVQDAVVQPADGPFFALADAIRLNVTGDPEQEIIAVFGCYARAAGTPTNTLKAAGETPLAAYVMVLRPVGQSFAPVAETTVLPYGASSSDLPDGIDFASIPSATPVQIDTSNLNQGVYMRMRIANLQGKRVPDLILSLFKNSSPLPTKHIAVFVFKNGGYRFVYRGDFLWMGASFDEGDAADFNGDGRDAVELYHAETPPGVGPADFIILADVYRYEENDGVMSFTAHDEDYPKLYLSQEANIRAQIDKASKRGSSFSPPAVGVYYYWLARTLEYERREADAGAIYALFEGGKLDSSALAPTLISEIPYRIKRMENRQVRREARF
jgi:hypothetical protein